MNISCKGQYALHAIFDLALNQSGQPIRIAAIATRQKIPQKFLELILASLKQGGFVEARRGAEGGYFLARHPSAITVGEVLRFVETSHARQPKAASGETPFAEVWRNIDLAVAGVVDHTTFAEIVRNWGRQDADVCARLEHLISVAETLVPATPTRSTRKS